MAGVAADRRLRPPRGDGLGVPGGHVGADGLELLGALWAELIERTTSASPRHLGSHPDDTSRRTRVGDDSHVAVAVPPAPLVDRDSVQVVELVRVLVASDPALDDPADAASAHAQ